MKTAVVTDTGCGLRQKDVRWEGFYLIPLQIIINEQPFEDGVDIDTADVLEALKEGQFPKTSMPVYQDIEETFRRIRADGYDEIIAIPLSSGLSSTLSSMRLASDLLNIPMIPVDTCSTCQIQRYAAQRCIELVHQGLSGKEAAERVMKKAATSNSLLLPNDMNYLKHGGRLTPLAANLANLLKIRPILTINRQTEGRIDVLTKVRTESRAMKNAVETALTEMTPGGCKIFLIHTASLDRAELLYQKFIEAGYLPEDIEIHEISSVIAVHTGLDCAVIQWIEKI